MNRMLKLAKNLSQELVVFFIYKIICYAHIIIILFVFCLLTLNIFYGVKGKEEDGSSILLDKKYKNLAEMSKIVNIQ